MNGKIVRRKLDAFVQVLQCLIDGIWWIALPNYATLVVITFQQDCSAIAQRNVGQTLLCFDLLGVIR
jgi:hypothetical protein